MWWMLIVPFWQRFACIIYTQRISLCPEATDSVWCLYLGDLTVWSTRWVRADMSASTNPRRARHAKQHQKDNTQWVSSAWMCVGTFSWLPVSKSTRFPGWFVRSVLGQSECLKTEGFRPTCSRMSPYVAGTRKHPCRCHPAPTPLTLNVWFSRFCRAHDDTPFNQVWWTSSFHSLAYVIHYAYV